MKILILGVILIGSVFSQNTLTEEEAVNYAMKHNLSLKRQTLKLDYLNKEVLQGYLTYLPTVSLNHSMIKFSDENLNQMKLLESAIKGLITSGGGDPDEYPSTAFENVFRSNLTINWSIFANGQALNWLSSKKIETDIEDISFSEEKRVISLKVREVYFTLAIVQKATDINKNRLKTSKERYEQILRLVDKGLRSNSEKIRWALQVSQAEEAVLSSESDSRIAQINLNFELGAPISERFIVELNSLEKKRFSKITEDYITSFDRSNISLSKKSELRLNQTENSKFYSYGKFLPSVNGLYTKKWQQHEKSFQDPSTWEASLNFSWNLFNGGKDIIDVQKAEISRYSAELSMKETHRQIEMLLTQYYFELAKSRKKLVTSDRSFELAKETFRLTKNRYEKGLSTNIEYLETENALYESEMNKLSAYKMYLSSGFLLKNLLEHN
jgi:outer membrane protein